MPTLALAMEIDSMGAVEALGFVAPLVYFIFIILSTLRQSCSTGRCSIIVPAASIPRPIPTIIPCVA